MCPLHFLRYRHLQCLSSKSNGRWKGSLHYTSVSELPIHPQTIHRTPPVLKDPVLFLFLTYLSPGHRPFPVLLTFFTFSDLTHLTWPFTTSQYITTTPLPFPGSLSKYNFYDLNSPFLLMKPYISTSHEMVSWLFL